MAHADPESVQAATLSFLRAELSRIDDGTSVSTIRTHISVILLSGTLAWKLKRAVQLPYLDFRSAEQRLALCRRELEMNRRTAPGLYRQVRCVMRQADGRLCLDDAAPDARDDDATLVDAIVEMRRFDETGVLARMAVDGRLDAPLVTKLAGVIAQFHQREPPAQGLARTGSQRIDDILSINEEGLTLGQDLLGQARVRRVATASRRLSQRHAALLNERQRDGHVRLCHGDLHLGNIVSIDGVPTLFDCLEFDIDMATIDVLYDLSFTLMDLWHRNLQSLANLLLNRYLDMIDETEGLPLLGLFMAMRATVRAHVGATQASDSRADDGAEARAYLTLADRLLQPRAPRLVAIGGLSGSGKSTVAAAIAAGIGPAPGARIVSSDRVRKRLYGVSAETRLPESAYRAEVSAQVYRQLRQLAAQALACGHSVIVDAVFDRPADREAIAGVAAAAGVPLHGIWLEAPARVLLDRVAARRGDASDAGEAVVHRQLDRDVGPLNWQRVETGDGEAAGRLRSLLD